MIGPSVCVFCGSRPGNDPIFARQAEEVGQILAANKWRLVYGAGDLGLMGTVARSAQEAGAGASAENGSGQARSDQLCGH